MERFTAVVHTTTRLAKDLSCIDFTVTDPRFMYTPGQYITVYFEGSSQPAGKAYSLAGLPTDSLSRIIVKNVGEFSSKLCALKKHDTFTCSAGYGHLNPKTTRPLVCFTGGIGIAPIWSIIRSELVSDPNRDVTLVHSHSHEAVIPCHEAIKAHQKNHTTFHTHTHITRQKTLSKSMKAGRIAAIDYIDNAAEDTVYLLCGSVEFVKTMWHDLVEAGVQPQRISAESFFE